MRAATVEPMRALTLTQPWATLVALGVKRVETRSWRTAYRGPIAIHAGRTMPCRSGQRLEVGDWVVERYREGLLLRGPAGEMHRLPQGVVVATARLEHVRAVDELGGWPPEPERSFGNYGPGRYAWLLGDVAPLREPLAAKGALGLWTWDPASAGDR